MFVFIISEQIIAIVQSIGFDTRQSNKPRDPVAAADAEQEALLSSSLDDPFNLRRNNTTGARSHVEIENEETDRLLEMVHYIFICISFLLF
jgi:hypothetical protein